MSNDTAPARVRRGLLFVLSSPSGAGKTTLSAALRRRHPDLELSVSVTTRPPRPGETDGVEYHFWSRHDFETARSAGHFYEWAEVHGNLYGTPKGPVGAILARGHDVLLDIDWQGAQQLFQTADQDIVSVFVLPPSMGELEARLNRRAADAADVIARRLKNARDEITHWAEYDYALVNDDVEQCLDALDVILTAERLRRRRQTWLAPFVSGLLASSAKA